MIQEVLDLGLIRVWGKKYDLPLLIETTEFLVEELRTHYGCGRPTVSLANHPRRYDWPEPGRTHSREAWRCYAAGADRESCLERSVIYSLGNISIIGYLLGSSRLVLQSKLSVLVDPSGLPTVLADPVPCLCVLGPAAEEPGEHRMLHPETAAAMERLVGLRHESLQLKVAVTNPVPGNRGAAVMISFPHSVYGAGVGFVDVSCAAVDIEHLERLPAA
jgi:hypothetical protein